jgi:hypothetical protein
VKVPSPFESIVFVRIMSVYTKSVRAVAVHVAGVHRAARAEGQLEGRHDGDRSAEAALAIAEHGEDRPVREAEGGVRQDDVEIAVAIEVGDAGIDRVLVVAVDADRRSEGPVSQAEPDRGAVRRGVVAEGEHVEVAVSIQVHDRAHAAPAGQQGLRRAEAALSRAEGHGGPSAEEEVLDHGVERAVLVEVGEPHALPKGAATPVDGRCEHGLCGSRGPGQNGGDREGDEDSDGMDRTHGVLRGRMIQTLTQPESRRQYLAFAVKGGRDCDTRPPMRDPESSVTWRR